MRTGVIYIAINKLSKKVYIGQTIQLLGSRISQHYNKAFKRNINNKFPNALRKYDKNDWIWEIVEANIPQHLLDEKEIYYINYYNSFHKGYNSTSGGETYIRTEITNKKSSESAKLRGANRVDINTYVFFNKYSKITFVGTREQLRETFNLSMNGFGALFIRKKPALSYKGWTLINK